MALEESNAIRVELRQRGTQKGGKYKRRESFYVYLCSACGKEIAFTYSELRRVSGRCKTCSNKETGKKTSIRERLEPYKALFNKFMYDRARDNHDVDLTFLDFLEFTAIRYVIIVAIPLLGRLTIFRKMVTAIISIAKTTMLAT